jgi:hypothetical protein
VSDIDTAAADSLKVLDPERPIREADMAGLAGRERPIANVSGSYKLARTALERTQNPAARSLRRERQNNM